jgi:hypothetical protein
MRIDHEGWKKVSLPFTHVEVVNPSFRLFHRELILKWIDAHCDGGWYYYDDSTNYTFEKNEDAVMFQMWITANPFKDNITEHV